MNPAKAMLLTLLSTAGVVCLAALAVKGALWLDATSNRHQAICSASGQGPVRSIWMVESDQRMTAGETFTIHILQAENESGGPYERVDITCK